MLVLLSTLAFADIPPPEDYVETCTVEKVQADNPGAECKSCDGWHGGREDCEALEEQGYTAKCRTAGASTWDEVLCKGGKPAPAEPEAKPADTKPAEVEPTAPPEKKDCNSAGGSGTSGALALALLALVGRRSR